MPKKIVINGLQYKQNSSGIGVLIRDLFAPFTESTVRTCQVILPQDSPDFPAKCSVEEVRIPLEHKNHIHRMVFQSFVLGRKYCKDSILLTTDSKTPFFIPSSCTVLPIVTDLAVFRMPEVYQKSRVLWWRFQYRYLCRKAQHFLAISEFTKREMVDILGLRPEQIDVVPCAASEQYKPEQDAHRLERIRNAYQLPEQYLLFVGNQNPRKNLDRILLAYDRAIEQGGFPHHLVIAGEQGWKFDREACLATIKNRDRVHFIGFIPDEDMPAIYTAASLFLFPTVYEGFGIPVLEAQLCGTPVLTSDCTSLPEVGGEGAIYVNPYRVEDIAGGILRTLGNSERLKNLVQKGFKNTRRFSWDRSARKLNDIIERIAEK